MKVQETCSKERDKPTFGSIKAGECFSYCYGREVYIKVYNESTQPLQLNAVNVRTGRLVVFGLDYPIDQVHKDAVLMTKGC